MSRRRSSVNSGVSWDSHSHSCSDNNSKHEDDYINDGKNKEIRSSIESLGCHIPFCVAHVLESNGKTSVNNDDDLKEWDGKTEYSTMRAQTAVLSRWEESSLGSKLPKPVDRIPSQRRIFQKCSSLSTANTMDSRITLGKFPMPSLPVEEDPYYKSALLLVDISGFTRLSTLLDVEALSKAINTYFELLIRNVRSFGGDVLKFAGDAFYAEWREQDDLDLDEAVLHAALCGASIVRQYSKYSVPELNSIVVDEECDKNDALLDVHCGIGVGKMTALHVGNDEIRREFLFLGGPIDQVSTAEAMAEHGQLAASPQALEVLMTLSKLDIKNLQHPAVQPVVIASNKRCYFKPNDPSFEEDAMLYCQRKPSYLTMHLSTEFMKSIKHQMSLYVHPAARRSHTRNVIADAEIRSIYTIFIKPEIKPLITGDKSKDGHLFLLLNNIMGVVSHILERFKGHLRQFIADDKGLVLIATFGQRGASFPNMVTEKGLPATIAIHEALKIDLDVVCRIGSTFGKAYVGVVGSAHRHEFAVLGPSVNLAARLMASKANPGILVDDAVRLMASERFDFTSHSDVRAKGYKDLVPTYIPKSAIERSWNKINNFVGRTFETRKLVSIGKQQLLAKEEDVEPCLVLIQAHSGMGKSSLAMEVMDKIRRSVGKYNKNATILKKVCFEREQHVPFSIFGQILHDLLLTEENRFQPDALDDDESGYISDSSISHISMDDGLNADSSQENENNIYGILKSMCVEMKYSVEFAHLVGQQLLSLKPLQENEEILMGKLQLNDIAEFVADLFLRCTSHAYFVLSAIDDIQWMDALSWRVLQLIMERGKRLMILCMSRPIEISNTGMKGTLLTLLRKEPKNKTGISARFTEIHLQSFSKNDVRRLLSVSYQCEEHHIHDDLCEYLYEQSGGMPYFTQEIVSNIIRNDMIEWRPDGTVDWRSSVSKSQKNVFSTMKDLLLHRLDKFKSDGRVLLQVCAVLGFNFSLSELLSVQSALNSRGKRKLKQKQIEIMQKVLLQAGKEGILVESIQGGSSCKSTPHTFEPFPALAVDKQKGSDTDEVPSDEQCGVVEKSYIFRHSIWRNCLLGTMLEERKRDLHRTIAIVLERNQKIGEVVTEPRSAIKLFGHWKASGSLKRATELARKIGKYFDNALLLNQSVEFCIEAIKMWKDWKTTVRERECRLLGGIKKELLDSVPPEGLESLARLHISVAKNYINMQDAVNSNYYYEACDDILSNSSSATQLKDRSVFFTLYSGRFSLLYIGAFPDDGLVMQMQISNNFVKQAEKHGDPLHLCRALSMKSLTLSRQGRFKEAVSVQKQLDAIYSAKVHSVALCREYSCDHSAQNYGYSLLWYEVLGRARESERQIDFILNKIMTLMPARNMHNSIMIVYPVMFVLKQKGMIRKAEEIFVKYVYDPFYHFFGKDSKTYFLFIYKPIRVLFGLAIDEQEEKDTYVKNEEELQALVDWALSDDVGCYKEIQWGPMCAMGRDPYCIIAEICFLLAKKISLLHQSNVVKSSYDKSKCGELCSKLRAKGLQQASRSMECTGGNPGFEYARRFHSEKVMKKYLEKSFDQQEKQEEIRMQRQEKKICLPFSCICRLFNDQKSKSVKELEKEVLKSSNNWIANI